MAENNNNSDHKEDVLEDFLNFSDDVGASSTCPICKKSEWQAIDGPPDGLLVPSLTIKTTPKAKLKEPRGMMQMSIPAIYFICDNCGFTRIHSLDVLNAWKNKQKPEQQ